MKNVSNSDPASKKSGKRPLFLYASLAILLAFAVVWAAFLRGATVDALVLSAPPGLVEAGTDVDLPVTLKTSSKTLSALEWQVSLPAGTSFEASTSIKNKTLQCFKQHCMLYGGQSAIDSGVVALIRVHLPNPLVSPMAIGLHDVLGATSDGLARTIGESSVTLKVEP